MALFGGGVTEHNMWCTLQPWSETFIIRQTERDIFISVHKSLFITVFTNAHHLSISWASSIKFIPPHPTSWRSILILSSHLCLGLPSDFFPSSFPNKTLYMPLPSSIHATCPVHLILLDLITRTIFGEEYKSLSPLLCSCLHSPVTSSLLGPNILLSTLFSNTLSLQSSLNVSDQVSHPYKKQVKL